MPQSLRILVVEDNDMSRALWLRLLQDWAYEPVGAGDGETAVKLAMEQPFDLMVCDILLPGQDGIVTISAVKRLHPGTAVIAISGTEKIGGDRFKEQAELAGADVFLFKPVEPVLLQSEIARLTKHEEAALAAH